MGKTSRTKQLRELPLETVAVALLIRRVAPHLVRDVVERLTRQAGARARLSRRRSRTRRQLTLAVTAVGVTAAGVAAARLTRRNGPFEDDATPPEAG